MNQLVVIETKKPRLARIKGYLSSKYAAWGAGATVTAMTVSSAHAAAIDVSDITSEISGLAAPIAAIGGAILLIYVGLKGWKVIKRAL